MRTIRVAALLLTGALAPGLLQAGNGVWTSTYPDGGSIHPFGLALDPSDSSQLYALPNWRGIYHSSDSGGSWVNITDYNGAYNVDRLNTVHVQVSASGSVFAIGGANRYALTRSQDGGDTWTIVEEFLFPDSTDDVAFDPLDPSIVYIGTSGGEVYKSTDGGDTWNPSSTGLPVGDPVWRLVPDPTDSTVLYLGTQTNGIYRTTDSGATWSSLGAMTSVGDIAVDPLAPSEVYAVDTAPWPAEVHKSTDSGATWSPLPITPRLNNSSGRFLALDPTVSGTVYVLDESYVQKSTDGGTTWNGHWVTEALMSTLILDPSTPNTLYAGTWGEGVFRSIDGGVTWAATNSGLKGHQPDHSSPHSLAFDSSDSTRIYAGTTFEGFRSTDSGSTWRALWVGLDRVFRLTTHSSDPGVVYAFQNDLWRSTDYGSTWAPWNFGYFCCFAEGDVVVHSGDSQTLYLAGYDSGFYPDGIYKSTNGGIDWAHLPGSPYGIRSLEVDANDGEVVYAATAELGGGSSAVFKTTDGGSSWSQLGGGLPADFHGNEIVVHPSDSNLVYFGCEGGGGNNGVYKSTDAGANWQHVLAENVTSVEVDPSDINRVYVGTWNTNGFYRSLDGGGTWALINDGLPPYQPVVEAIEVDPANSNRILANTPAGVYELTFAGTVTMTVTNANDSGPGSFRDALTQANQDGVPNVITFAPWMAGTSIGPQSNLPAFTEGGTTLDGDLDGDCVPDIEISGWGAGGDGVNIQSADNTVRGLVINGFPGNGVIIHDAAATGNVVECNFIGTDFSGGGGAGNNYGVHFTGSSSGTRLGGHPLTQRNVISGNQSVGVHVLESDANLLTGNLIGVAVDRSTPLGNSQLGVLVQQDSSDNVIGPDNVIAHNGNHGVQVTDGLGPGYPGFAAMAADGVEIFPIIHLEGADGCGPFASIDGITPVDGSGSPFIESFGARFTGTLTVGAGGTYTFDVLQLDDAVRLVIDSSVELDTGGGPDSVSVGLGAGPHDLEIDYQNGSGGAVLELAISGPGTASLTTDGNAGGCSPGESGLCGELFHLRIPSERNTITQNSIHDNGGWGIANGCGPMSNDTGDVDVGPNTLLNHPDLTGTLDLGGGDFQVDGTAPPNSTVEVFALAADPSGYGEGAVYLDSGTADGGGAFSFSVNLPGGYYSVTATATDLVGNTSDFSQYMALTTHYVTVDNTNDSGPGSLRDALEQGNVDGAPTEITFDGGLAGQTIHLLSPLPPIIDADTTIDGDMGGDCIPDIALDGSLTGGGQGLELQSSNNWVRGLAIHSFSGQGIFIAPRNGPPADGNVVECNHIGTDLDGTAILGNAWCGVSIEEVSNNNRIGPQNILAHNGWDGVAIFGSYNYGLYPDFGGLTPDPVQVFPVIEFSDQNGAFESADAIIPVDGSGATFTERFGVRFTGTLTVGAAGDYTFDMPQLDDEARIVVDGSIVLETCCGGGSTNWMLGAGAHPIEIDYVEHGGAASLQVDITGPGAVDLSTDGNAAGCSTGEIGLCGEFFREEFPSEQNTVTQNAIYDNGEIGIDIGGDDVTPNDPGDLDTGSNQVLNFPELTGFTDNGGGSFTVDGTAPPSSTVELFGAAPDPSGYGEGQVYVGTVAADVGGNFSTTVALPPESFAVTATATDALGNTSEFSQNLTVKIPDAVTVDNTSAYQGEVATVPIYVRDLAATPLGVDQPAGELIQGFIFQVTFSPAVGVVSADIQRAGIAAGLTPLWETSNTVGNTVTYIASYNETTNPLPFALDGAVPGDMVAELVLTLDLAAPPTLISLTLEDGSVLSNQGGTTTESRPEGTLNLMHGSLDVLPRSATALSAAAQSSSEIRLWWNDPNSDEIGFRVERSPDGSSWGTVATLGPDETSYPDSGLPAASLFYYQVVAFSLGGDAAPSNIAAAQTFPATAALACVQPITFQDHSWARFADVSWNGSYWGTVRQERNGGTSDEINFQLLHPDGWPTGVSIPLAENDMQSQFPNLIWNGTHFGVFWSEHMRGPIGAENRGTNVFSLLDAWGQPVRERARLLDYTVQGGLNNDVEFSFVWDGSGWGHVAVDLISDTETDVFFWSFDEPGDLLNGPVNVSNTPGDAEWSTRLAWSGTEHGIVWVREESATPEVLFQRKNPDGSSVTGDPPPVQLWQGTADQGVQVTDILWNGSGWAVVWDVIDNAVDEEWIALRLLAPDGTPLGPVKRLSDTMDAQMAEQGEDWWPAYDELPKLMASTGGGYLVFTSSYTAASGSWAYEIGLLEADANGDRVEYSPGLARRIVSDLDSWHSVYQRVATDGTSFMATYNDNRQGSLEVSSVRVAGDGSVLAGPHDLTSGHSPGNGWFTTGATNSHVTPLAGGFATVWTDSTSGTYQVYSQIFDPTGAPGPTLAPLSGREIMGTPGLLGVGDTFAVAWKDGAGNLVFTRFDTGGNSLVGEVEVATGTSTRSDVRVAFSGEVYGILYRDDTGLQLQQVDPGGSPVGGPTWVTDVVRSWPQIYWVGAGWAVLWRGLDNDLHYALVDSWGGTLVSDTVLTSTGRMGFFNALWTGEMLGLAWRQNRGIDPSGAEIYFTVLNLDGSFAIPEVMVQNAFFSGGGGPHLYWQGDRFHLIRPSGTPVDGTWEDEILPDGTLFGNVRQLSNRGSAGAVAFDGATLAQVWNQFRSDLYFQTDACLGDGSPPSCPDVTVAMGSTGVDLSWSPASDPESGIYRYLLYRDGVQLAELFDTTGNYTDGGHRRQPHTYSVRALNGAYTESSGCPDHVFSTVPGDANGDGVVSEADVFYLINYFYSGEELPWGDGDANSDGQVTVADIFFLINYLFGGGPEPTAPLQAFPEQASDVLTVGSASGLPGATLRVPVFIQDVTGTPLDELGGPDAGIQGLAFQVTFSSPGSIVSGAFEVAGLTASASPVFPVVDYRGDDIIVLVNFRESAAALAFTPDASAPGDLVGELVLNLAGSATPGSTVSLVVAPLTAELINDTATVGERAAAGTLTVEDGAVLVLDPEIFSDGFEEGHTNFWSSTVGG